MVAWLVRYHRHLITKAAETPALGRYFGVQSVAAPWFMPLMAMLLWGILFTPPEGLRKRVVLIVCVPILLGMIYAMSTYIVAGVFADRRSQRQVR
jgi:hypothetical protein